MSASAFTKVRACIKAAIVAVLTASSTLAATGQAAYVRLPGGSFVSLLPPDGRQALARVSSFSMRTLPVTQAEFAAFVKRHPDWQKAAKVSSTLADSQYLADWPRPAGVASGQAQSAQPVTRVSWFASAAFCDAEGARLPTWHEWEYAAAADARKRDARADPLWRAHLLDWYGQPSKTLPVVGQGAKNVYGVHDLHGLIWEWVDDFGAMMVSGDNRTQGDPDVLQFCGAGALSANDRENYPVLMRMAMLSALQAASTNRNLGFRCVRDAPR